MALLLHVDARPQVVICSFCQREFPKQGCLAAHLLNVHPEQKHPLTRKRKTCDLVCDVNDCKKVCKYPSKMNEHKRLVHGPFSNTPKKKLKLTWKCPKCDFEGSSWTLLRHDITVHNSKNKHSCIDCNKWFLRPDKLKQHIARIHSALREHKCHICSKDFALPQDLKDHLRRVHPDAEQEEDSPFDGEADTKKAASKKEKLLPKEESCLYAALVHANIPFSLEKNTGISISFKWLDINLTYCMLDCVLQQFDRKVEFDSELKNIQFVLETDEHQHDSYPCDIKRTFHILESLRLKHPDDVIVFIRYNPHKFWVNGLLQPVTKTMRLQAVTSFIKEYVPKKQHQVASFYFAVVNGQLSHLLNTDFSKEPGLLIENYKNLVTHVCTE